MQVTFHWGSDREAFVGGTLKFNIRCKAAVAHILREKEKNQK